MVRLVHNRRLAAGALAIAAVAWFPSRSEAASTFSASSGGEVARTVVQLVPPTLQAELVDPGAISAQASLTSFGESAAFASNPFPGSIPVSAPGLIDGALAPSLPPELTQLLNLPEYPLIASSSYPTTPSSTVAAGPAVLTAESSERESSGAATDGLDRTTAEVRADASTDVVTASATSQVGAVDLAPLLQVSGILSSATAVQGADGQLERTSEFSVASISVLGQRLRLTPDGLELAGATVPAGRDEVLDPVDALLSSLEEHGVSLRFIEASDTPEGIMSAGLEISRSFDTGVNGIVATVTVTLGRTFANVSNAARPPLGASTPLPTPSPAGSTPATGGAAGLVPSAGAAAGPRAAPPSSTAAAPGPAISPGDRRISALVPDTDDAARFYPVLVLGGAVFVAGVSLFRKIGARSTWTS